MVALLNMDLLLIIDYVLLLLLYVALWAILRQWNGAFAILALVLQVVGTATYFSTAVAFGMFALSNQYSAAGNAVLVNWQETAFSVSYLLTGAATLTVSLVMLKSKHIFGKAAAYASIVAGTFSFVPSTAGQLGLVLSILSLPPLAVWLVLVFRRLLKPRSLVTNPIA